MPQWSQVLADIIYPALMGLSLFQALGTALLKIMIAYYGSALWHALFNVFIRRRWLRLWISWSAVVWLMGLAAAFCLLSLSTGTLAPINFADSLQVLRLLYLLALLGQLSTTAAWLVIMTYAWGGLGEVIREARTGATTVVEAED